MSLKIIMGNMFSGKTSELVRRLKRYEVIGKRILVINSCKDTRCAEHVLRTHDNMKFKCIKTEHRKLLPQNLTKQCSILFKKIVLLQQLKMISA